MGKEIVSQVQEAQRVPYRINPRRNTPRHILIKLSKRISFRYDGEIITFTGKQKLREFSTTKPALQQMLKELL